MISTLELTSLFTIEGISVEGSVGEQGYDVSFKCRIGGVIHEFKHKTMFSRIEKSGESDLMYMTAVSRPVKSECLAYFNRVRGFVSQGINI